MDYIAQPFFKWLGGKRKMVKQFRDFYPPALKNGEIDTYIEPFVGGGAVLLDILQNYKVRNSAILDANVHVITAFIHVRDDCYYTAKILQMMVDEFNAFPTFAEKEKYFYQVRHDFNESNAFTAIDTARFLFLQKAVYNGVHRVNQSGKFNAPFGKGCTMRPVDERNFQAVSELLQETDMICGDYSKCERLITDRTFIYFDPPYRPYGKSEYIKYVALPFTDIQQIQLSDFYQKVSDMGAAAMLSNRYCGDGFFEELYKPFHIDTVIATHAVKRQTGIKEILVTNYERS